MTSPEISGSLKSKPTRTGSAEADGPPDVCKFANMRRSGVSRRDQATPAVAVALIAAGGLCAIPTSALGAVGLSGWQIAYPTTKLDLRPRGQAGIVLKGKGGPAGIQQFVKAPTRPFAVRLLNRGPSAVKVRLEWSQKGKVGGAAEKTVKPSPTAATVRFLPLAPSKNVLRVLVRLERGQGAVLERMTLKGKGRNALKNSRLSAQCSDFKLPGWRQRYGNMTLTALPNSPGVPVVMRSETGLAGIDQALTSPERPFAVRIQGHPGGARAAFIAEWSNAGQVVERKRTRLVLRGGSQTIPLTPPKQVTAVQLQLLELSKRRILQVDSVRLQGRSVPQQLVNPALAVPGCSPRRAARIAAQPMHHRVPLYVLAIFTALGGAAAIAIRRRRRL